MLQENYEEGGERMSPDEAEKLNKSLDEVKTKIDELQRKIDGMSSEEIESQKEELQEDQTQTFEQFIEESIRSTGKISEVSQEKLKKIYSQTYEDLMNRDGDTQKVKDLKSKLQEKMVKNILEAPLTK